MTERKTARRSHTIMQIGNLKCGSLEAVSKLGIIGNKTRPAPEARKTIARDERSESLVMEANRRSPGGAKDIEKEAFRPFRALSKCKLLPGVCCAHPWLLSGAPYGAWEANPGLTLGFETASLLPPLLLPDSTCKGASKLAHSKEFAIFEAGKRIINTARTHSVL